VESLFSSHLTYPMKLLPVFRRTRIGVLLTLPLLLLGSYAIHEAGASSGGVYKDSQSGCGGYGCHGLKSSATVISISTSSNSIQAGQTYIFRLSVANSTEAAAGCDISVDSGAKLAVDSTGLYLSYGGELTHRTPRYFGYTDSAVWLFKYKAPSKPGVAHIYVAGNAVNGNGTNDAGDHWNLAVDTLTVVAAASVTPKANPPVDVRIFPNPSTTGHLTLATSGISGPAQVTVSDAAGRIVLGESMMLGTESPLDLSALPNGTYFVSLRTKDGPSFVRSIVIAR